MKIYIFFFCLLISAAAIAQTQSISINYKPSLSFFGKKQFNSYYSMKGNATFKNGINLLYSHKLFSKLSFSAGIEYSQQGQNISLNTDSVYPSNYKTAFKIELNYIRFPFVINYDVMKFKRSTLNIYSGISYGAAIKRKDNYAAITFTNLYIAPADERYKKDDWAIPFGINFQQTLAKKIFIHSSVEYMAGITNASTFGLFSEFKNTKQSRLSLNVGAGFNF